MKLEFNFEIADWIEFQKHYLNNLKNYKRTIIIVSLIVPLIFTFIILLDLSKGKFDIISVIVFAIFSLLWMLFFPKHMRKRTLLRIKKTLEKGDNQGILGKHEIILNKEGIFHKTAESEGKINWAGVKKIEESETHYFLYNTSVSAIIIPKQKLDIDLNELDEVLKSNIA